MTSFAEIMEKARGAGPARFVVAQAADVEGVAPIIRARALLRFDVREELNAEFDGHGIASQDLE